MSQVKTKAIDISEGKIKQIFSNISLIYNINFNLYTEIDSRVNIWSDTQTVGDIFKDVVSSSK